MTSPPHYEPPVIPLRSEGPLDPSRDKEIWIDRPTEWESIKMHFRRANWFVLMGNTGMGRTSTLRWIHERCERMNEGFVPLTVDLPELARERKMPAAIEEFGRKIRDRVGQGLDVAVTAVIEHQNFSHDKSFP